MDRIGISLGQSGNFISGAVRVQGFINCDYKETTPKFRSGPCCSSKHGQNVTYVWILLSLNLFSVCSFSTQRSAMGFQENKMFQVVGQTTVGLT